MIFNPIYKKRIQARKESDGRSYSIQPLSAAAEKNVHSSDNIQSYDCAYHCLPGFSAEFQNGDKFGSYASEHYLA